MDRHVKATLIMLVSALSFSVLAPVSAQADQIDPIILLSCASFIAFFAHIPFGLEAKSLRQTFMRKGIILSFTGGGILTWGYIVFAYAIQGSNNAVATALIFELYPLFIILFSNLLIYSERLSAVQIGWLALSLVGALLVNLGKLPGTALNDHGMPVILLSYWNMLALCAVCASSLGCVLVSRAIRFGDTGHTKMPALASTMARLGGFITTLPFVLLILIGEHSSLATIGYNTIYIAIYGIVVLTAGNIAYYRAVYLSTSHCVNCVMYVAPVLGAIWMIMLGEGTMTYAIAIGGMLIIFSSYMANKTGHCAEQLE